jgi:uncharacterized protein YqgC (DUF456 family)
MHIRGRSLSLKKQIIGYTLLAAGIAGLVLPVVPGVVLILIGLRFLGSDHALARPVMGWIGRLRRR